MPKNKVEYPERFKIENTKGTTLFDVINSGYPYGEVADNLREEHRNFLIGHIFNNNISTLSEQAFFANIDPLSIIDENGQIREKAKSTEFVKTARQNVSDASDESKLRPCDYKPIPKDLKQNPEDTNLTPKMIDDLTTLLIRTSLATARLRRTICLEVIKRHTKWQKESPGQKFPSYERMEDDLKSFTEQHRDEKMVGSTSYTDSHVCYHLAMTLINPKHSFRDPSKIWSKKFSHFFKKINPKRLEMVEAGKKDLFSSFNDEADSRSADFSIFNKLVKPPEQDALEI